MITSWLLALVAGTYLVAAVYVPDPGDFVNCCMVGYLAMRTAAYWWEDSQ